MGVFGAPYGTIEPLARAGPVRPQRDCDRVVGRISEPDAHRVDGRDEPRRRRDARQDFLAIERIGDRARDRRACLAEDGRTAVRQLYARPASLRPCSSNPNEPGERRTRTAWPLAI